MRLDDQGLGQLFIEARTLRAWQPREVPDSLLRELTDRCAELDLRLKGESAAVEVAAYLATLASHYRLTGRFKGP